MQLQTPDLRAPFVVSVTGHKDIVENEALEEAFIAQLDEIKEEAQKAEQRNKKFKTKEWILLSALAEGADTLAACVALNREGWRVIAPLPLPVKEYRKDFEGAALEKFNELMEEKNCQHFFIGYAPGCDSENTCKDGECRDRQYAYLGEFLTRHCEVLIAFWDGHDAGGIGGTGYVVNLQREGLAGYSIDLRDDGILLDPPETGRTFAIWSKREKHTKKDAKFRSIAGGDEKHGTSDELPHGDDGKQNSGQPAVAETQFQRWHQHHQRWRQQNRKTREEDQEKKRREKHRAEWEEFVCEANKTKVPDFEATWEKHKEEQAEFKAAQAGLAAAQAEFEANKTELTTKQVEVAKAKVAGKKPKYHPLPLDLAENSDYLKYVRDAFLRADALAERYQAKAKSAFYLTTAIVLAFTLCVAGAGAYAQSRWNMAILVASWALLVSAYGLSWWQKKSENANRHQDYRALAEAWRIAFFWRALGIVTPLDTCYLRSQRGELDWIRQALRTADLLWRAQHGQCEPTPHGYPEPKTNDFQTVFTAWIQDQTKYFNKNVPKARVELTSLRHWSWALLILGLGASALESLVQIKEAEVAGLSGLWQFLLGFASAELLASPFVPALLLVLRMGSWPVATDENTKIVRADTKDQTDKRKKLRQQFVQLNAEWTFVAIGGGLLALAAPGAVLTGILPSAERVPFLQMLATLCFFLPSLIYVAAEHNALSEQVVNYERMSAIFARAKEMLEQLTNKSTARESDWSDAEVQAKARRIYGELGREALHENGEWLITHRERPLDVEI